MNTKTFFIVTSILGIVAIFGFITYLPTRIDSSSKIKVTEFPTKIGQWSSTDIPISERDYEILETRNLIVRDYKNPKGESVQLYLIYSEDNRKVSHPPEVCYMGSGVTVADKTQVRISDSVMANKLLVEKENARQLVVYWFKAGGLSTDKYLQQQLKVVSDRTFGKRTSGALIRMSVDLTKDKDQDYGLNLVKSFYAEIATLLDKYAP